MSTFLLPFRPTCRPLHSPQHQVFNIPTWFELYSTVQSIELTDNVNPQLDCLTLGQALPTAENVCPGGLATFDADQLVRIQYQTCEINM